VLVWLNIIDNVIEEFEPPKRQEKAKKAKKSAKKKVNFHRSD
jgi:hypothetical protein